MWFSTRRRSRALRDWAQNRSTASFDVDALAALLRGRRMQIKGLLRDQSVIAGIGNAYSDEILHVAKMSPFKIADTLTADEVAVLYDAMQTTLRDAVARAAELDAGELKAEKKANLRVHGRTGQPARCAATPCGRCRSPTRRCSTARPARPAASRSPTAASRAC